MQIQALCTEIENFGLDTKAQTSFGVKLCGKMFRALADTTYKDKVAAVIREVVCNGLDAHADPSVNKGTEPLEVHLPSDFEPYFSVKDNGTGLSHEFMMSRYTVAFDSTKDNSQTDIGGFGIGRLSVFSYADSYSVVSRQNGKKRTYFVYLQTDGMPAINPVSEEDTDECNGFEVRCAVQAKDFFEFRSKAARFFARLPVKPTVSGVEDFQPNPYVLSHVGQSNWGIREGGGAVFAVMGNVAYPVSVDPSVLSPREQALLELPLDIFCDIGELEVAMSRENLSLNDTSTERLKARLATIMEEVYQHFHERMTGARNLWEAKLILWDLLNGDLKKFAKFVKKDGVEWNGKPIDTMPLRSIGFDAISFERKEMRGRRNRGRKKISKITAPDIMVSRNVRVIINDLKTGALGRAKAIMEADVDATIDAVYLVRSFSGDDNQLLAAMGREGDVLERASQLPRPSRKSYTAGALSEKGKASVYFLDRTVDDTTDLSDYWDVAQDLDMDEGGIYVPVERYYARHVNYYNNAKPSEFINRLEHLAGALGIDIDDVEIVGVKAKRLPEFANHPKWKSVTEFMKDKAAEVINNPALIATVANNQEVERIEDHWITETLELLDDKIRTNGIFRAFADKVKSLKSGLIKIQDKWPAISDAAISLGVSVPNIPETKLIDMDYEYEMLVEAYPMMKVFSSIYSSGVEQAFRNHAEIVADYITGLDVKDGAKISA